MSEEDSALDHGSPAFCWRSATDVGQVRQENQDAMLADGDMGLFIVADGMGGQQAGALAARVVTELLPKMIRSQFRKDPQPSAETVSQWLKTDIVDLSAQLRRQSESKAGLAGMGATLVMVLLVGDRLHLAHMGDSRAYRLREQRLEQLTEDHSVVGILLRRGEITPQEAKTHPARSTLSRYVGMADEALPEVQVFPVEKGDRLLLCSDGLTGPVDDQSIAAILNQHADPQEACTALVAAANAAGGPDNVTVIVLDKGGWYRHAGLRKM